MPWPRGLGEVVTQAGPSPIGTQQTKIKDLTPQELTQTAEACSVLCLTRPDLRPEGADGQGREERHLWPLPSSSPSTSSPGALATTHFLLTPAQALVKMLVPPAPPRQHSTPPRLCPKTAVREKQTCKQRIIHFSGCTGLMRPKPAQQSSVAPHYLTNQAQTSYWPHTQAGLIPFPSCLQILNTVPLTQNSPQFPHPRPLTQIPRLTPFSSPGMFFPPLPACPLIPI